MLLKKLHNLTFIWCINQQFALNNIKTGLNIDNDNIFSGDKILDDIEGLMYNFDIEI